MRALGLAALGLAALAAPSVAQLCGPKLPGLLTAAGSDGGLLGYGYDLVTGTTKGAVVNYTFNNWMNCYTDPESGRSYQFPDQVFLAGSSQFSFTEQDVFFLTYTDYISFEMDESSTSFGWIIYNHNDMHVYFNQRMSSDGYVSAFSQSEQTLFISSLRYSPQELAFLMQPGKSMAGLSIAQELQLLPQTYVSDTDKLAYSTFIQRFGTHYVDSAVYGGQMNVYMMVNSSVIESTNITFTESQTEIGIILAFVDIGYMHASGDLKAQLSEIIQTNSEVLFVGYGGSPALILAGIWDLWSYSIPYQPAPVNVSVTPIWALSMDSTISANLQAAVSDYITANNPNPPVYPFPASVCGSAPGANYSIAQLPDPSSVRKTAAPLPSSSLRGKVKAATAGFSTDGTINGLETARLRAAFLEHEAKLAEVKGAKDAKEAKDAKVEEAAVPSMTRAWSKPLPEGVTVTTPPKLAEAEVASRLRAARAERGLVGDLIIPLPGVGAGIGRGFDVVTGDLLASVAFPDTYFQNKTWYDTFSNVSILIPDAMDFASTPSACMEEISYSYADAEAAASFHASITGFGFGLFIDGLSIGAFFAKEVASIAESLDNFDNGLSAMDRGLSLYRMSFGNSGVGVSLGFLDAISKLPSVQSAPYQEMLSLYGTHFVTEASFGGYCTFTVTYNIAMLQSFSEEFKAQQFGLMIGLMLQGIGIDFDLGFSKATWSGTVDATFKAASVVNYTCVGGDPTKLGNLDYLGWLLSINGNPAMLPHTMRLQPIYTLIYDPVKRGLMYDATVAYLTAASNGYEAKKAARAAELLANLPRPDSVDSAAPDAPRPGENA